MKVGFIGLGIMGSRMATHLQNAGHDLIVFNRTKSKAQQLLNQGASWGNSPAEVAQNCDLLITMLAQPTAIKETAYGTNGFLSTFATGKLWIDCSTVNPSFSREMAGAAQENRIRFLDAPVAGSKNQAAGAQLVFFVGGAVADFEEAKPLMDIMGKKAIHVGNSGMGSSLKIVVNLMLATSMAAFAEGVALGESLGIAQSTLFNVLIGGPVVPPYLAFKRDKMESGNYEVEFPLQWIQKDLQMATQTAFEPDVATPVTSATKEVYRLAMRDGLGELDFSAIYKYFQNK